MVSALHLIVDNHGVPTLIGYYCGEWPQVFFKLAILVFSAFGHRDLAKQVTLKVRLSGNLNTLPNTAFLTA